MILELFCDMHNGSDWPHDCFAIAKPNPRKAKICKHILCFPAVWPRRLTVRTLGFHPSNRGSIPRGVTNKKDSPKGGSFLLVISRSEMRTPKGFEGQSHTQELAPSMAAGRQAKGLIN